jgi:crotonobetainyl-CoA:carnitine CoA-transferase CaiB-like acyl-CoA transferase
MIGNPVIKIEPPGMGDVMRYMGATCNGISALYHNVNRGKRSLVLDLKSAEAITLVKELVTDADVVLQNFRPGVAERLGVGYEALCAVNPELIYLSVCGFGDRGPYSNKPAYDNVIQAFSGVAQSQANTQTGEPIQYYQLFCDKLTALTGSQAISSALFARERGQGGQHIRLSIEHPQAGTIIEPNNPPNFEHTPSPELRACASLGEHTDEILRHLGRDDAEIRRLREAGVIA